jgi:seryl-tRNA(Sec) selenium transferase
VLHPAHLEGQGTTLPLSRVLEIAHRRGVPVLVDAAGQVYPIEKFRGYPALGADLVCFGAKYIGAPHSTGILCGKKPLVDAAALQGFIGFESRTAHRAFGRPLKLDRQEIVAVVAALEEWLAMDHDQRLAGQEQTLRTIGQELDGLPGVQVEYLRRDGAAPRLLRVQIDPAAAARAAPVVIADLRAGSPPIYVGTEPDALLVNPSTLFPGEEQIVAQRLRALLMPAR